jgi:hypothetical protein
MRKIKYVIEHNRAKILNSRFGNLISKYDVIHDALKVMSDKNLNRSCNFVDGVSFGDIGSLFENLEIAWGYRQFLPPLYYC